MKKWITTALVLILTISACKNTKDSKKEKTEEDNKAFSIEILDDAALELIDPATEIKILAEGFSWTEGPLWVEDGEFLLFSDIPNNKIYRWDARNDTITYLHPSGFTGENFPGKEPGSNGLLLNQEGELVLLQHGDRRVAKMNSSISEPKADFSTVVDNYRGKRLNSPNDATYDTNGNLYFTDPPYGLPEQMEDPEKELDFQGVYCLLNSGDLVLLDSLSRPNGVALSPDESVLYVAVSDPEQAVWYSYQLPEPGKVDNRTLIQDVTRFVGMEGQKGLPDGLKVHSKGFLFATGPGGVWILDPKGKPLARIYTGQATANCTLAMNEKVLFMTADDYLMSVSLK